MSYVLLQGHVLDHLRTLPGESFQCVVCSPPYYGLRAYGTEPQIWGGDPDCPHGGAVPAIVRAHHNRNGIGSSSLGAANRPNEDLRGWSDAGRIRAGRDDGYWGGLDYALGKEAERIKHGSLRCTDCGAWRGELGLEPDHALYVEHLVEIFRESAGFSGRDGVLFLNLGDTLASAWSVNRRNVVGNGSLPDGTRAARPNRLVGGLKEKDLIGTPWAVAFALRDDGWYLRSEIIWHKINPMPEAVQDRPTKAHEQVLLLTKSARYYYNAVAIAEPAAGYQRKGGSAPSTANGWTTNGIGSTSLHQMADGTRNARSVWTIPTKPFPEAHFAVMPTELARRCILAGSREGSVILDPFSGAGTTGLVAITLQREYLGIELSPEYAAMAERRIRGEYGLDGLDEQPAPDSEHDGYRLRLFE